MKNNRELAELGRMSKEITKKTGLNTREARLLAEFGTLYIKLGRGWVAILYSDENVSAKAKRHMKKSIIWHGLKE